MHSVKVALIFKDFSHWVRSSCVGLHVAGYATAEVLRDNSIEAHAHAVRHNVDIVHLLDHAVRPYTHVVISAPWLSVHDLRALITHYPDTQFVILSHSNVGFLQADPGGVHLLRKYHELTEFHCNLRVGGNSRKFVDWLRTAYGRDVVWLPNLYPIGECDPRPCVQTPLIIGAFGAVRPQKNFMTAAAAAVAIHRLLGVPVELHMSSGGEGDQGTTIPAIEQMCSGLADFKLVRHDWNYWDQFIGLIGQCDLLLQPSYTESFNMITADGISVGVPSVVSSAISWAPKSWQADSDDALDISHTAVRLLENREVEIEKGVQALFKHNHAGLKAWKHYLGLESWFEKLLG